MKKWPILAAIASSSLVTLGTNVYAQNITLSPEGITSPQPTYANAGIRIKSGNIVTAFHGHLINYVGNCPGSDWTGSASYDNARFVSYRIPPAKHLRVSLINLTSGESITKKYTKTGKGSFDFPVIRLGRNTGLQKMKYTIYNKKTNSVLESGDFDYNLTTTYRTEQRDGEWRSELYCSSNESDAISDCEVVGEQERLYCDGSRTSHIRDRHISYRRRHKKTNHHSGSNHRHTYNKPSWW